MNVMTMTRIKYLTFGVLLALLITGASLTAKATPVLASTSIVSVVNADGGVYWRSDPDWNTPIKVSRQGIYTNDTVALECYQIGGTVPPYYNNSLWYWADIVSGYGQGSGWANDHFLQTGTNQPNIPVAGVPPCYGVSSNYSDGANVRALPDGYSENLARAYNGYQLTVDCWVYGDWFYGNSLSNIWFQVAVPDDKYGGVGYINASLVNPLPKFPPPCPSTA